MWREPAEFFKAPSQDRTQQSSAEQTIEPPTVFLVGTIFEVPVIQTQRRTHQGENTHVQHVVDTVEVEKHIIQGKINQVTKHIDIPPLQFTEKVVDIPVVAQGQAHRIQMVKETKEVHQLQHTYQVFDVTVAVGRAEVPRARRGEDS